MFSVILSMATALAVLRADGFGSNVALGFISGVVLAGGVVFAQAVIASERQNRHYLFLQTLPLETYRIVAAKFIAVLLLSLALANIPGVVGQLAAMTQEIQHASFGGVTRVLKLNSFVISYTSIVLLFTMAFRNPAASLFPFLLAALLVVGSDSGPLKKASKLFTEADALFFTAPVISVAVALLCFFIAVAVVKCREVDL